MCGIAGVINLRHKISDIDQATTNSMIQLIQHRGPDNSGFYFDDKVSLSNARLSIMDPRPEANLPFLSDDKNVVLCFNGEITNFIELKLKYNLSNDFNFKTNSDSEVLLNLYLKFGIQVLKELTGMFALVLFDKRVNKVYFARDFYGIIPLFYFRRKNQIYFCSEIKGILEVPNFKKEINRQSIFDYLTLAYVPGSQTAFEGIEEVRNGELLTICLTNEIIEKKYFYRMSYNINHNISFDEATKRVKELLFNSVKRNLRSDVPTGITLSGGVDTSGIVSIANELGLSNNLHTFSIKMGEDSFDESHFQRLVSKKCNTIHHEYLVTAEDVHENFYKHLAHIDEPLGDGASIPFYILANKAKKYVKVLLNGEGGDEVFNAYSIYQAWKIRKYYKGLTPKPVRSLIHKAAHCLKSDYSKLSFDFMAKRFTEGAELHPAAAHIYWRHPFTNSEKASIFKGNKYRNTDDILINLYNEFSHTHELNRVSMLDFEYFLTDDLLLKNDHMIIAHSIEGRFPYLDRELIDFVQTLPTSYKLKGLTGRYIQKKALEGVLPHQILKRQNYGLEMPHSLWFFDGLKPLTDKYLNFDYLEKFDFLDSKSIMNIFNLHKNKQRDYGRGLWCLINFLAWNDMFIETSDYKKYLVRKN